MADVASLYALALVVIQMLRVDAVWRDPGRLDTIAWAVAYEAHAAAGVMSARDLVVLGLVVSEKESGQWDRKVHDGRKLGDHGKAWCLMQVHKSSRFAPSPENLVGTSLEATRRCFRAGLRILSYHWTRCGSGASGAAAGYCSGHACKGFCSARARRFWRLRRLVSE